MENTYEELKCLFLNNGYEATVAHEPGIEAQSQSGIVFSAMKENGYFEAALSFSNNDAVVSYDIFSAEYQTDVFAENAATREKVSLWLGKLREEVGRLDLEKYKG